MRLVYMQDIFARASTRPSAQRKGILYTSTVSAEINECNEKSLVDGFGPLILILPDDQKTQNLRMGSWWGIAEQIRIFSCD